MTQRILKFRAWDKEKKIMHFGGSFFDIGEIYDEDKFWYFGIQVKSHPDNIELMQFTDLLDKNGKEIYEGDIIQWHNTGDNKIDEIVFNSESASFSLKESAVDGYKNSIIPLGILDNQMFEVIGNIYSNPDLLTKED